MMKLSKAAFFLAFLKADTATAEPIKTTERIVGGVESEPGSFPYFVEMGGCGGSLVSPDTVLFAAHCGNWQGQQIIIGSYNAGTLDEGAQARFCDVWIPDPLYGTGGSDINNDFALCKLDQPVTVSKAFVTLELNENNSVPSDGADLIVMGHGATSQGGPQASTLRQVTVPTVSNAACSNSYPGQITDAMLCAGFPQGQKDSCQGDSGGPIVRRTSNADGTFVDTQVGVVSWGEGCALPDFPGVYARVSSRVGWIKETMCNTFNSVAPFCNNSPPPACDNAQNLIIRLTTDQYAQETSFTLTDTSNGEVIMSRSYSINNIENEHQICLQPDRCYDWTVRDSYGDGVPDGSYALVLGGNTIASGNGDFQESKTERVCTGSGNPVPAPTPPPTSTNFPVPPPTSTNFPVPPPTSTNFPVPPPTSTNFPVPPPTSTNFPVPPPTSTNFPVPSPTFTDFPVPPTNGDCNGSPALKIQLKTDNHGLETFWYLDESIAAGTYVIEFEFGYGYESNTEYTLPSSDPNDAYCLKENTCYVFSIWDNYGDGMMDVDGHYAGFLNGVEIFSGDGNFQFNRDHDFCTGAASNDDDASNDGPTIEPTSDVTNDDPFLPTIEPTTEDPTSFPTAFPTFSPTAFPTSNPTGAEGCSDDPAFRFKGREKKDCNWVRKGNAKKVKKKCNKKHNRIRVHEYCKQSCGKKAGVGVCGFLKKKKKPRNKNKMRRMREMLEIAKTEGRAMNRSHVK